MSCNLINIPTPCGANVPGVAQLQIVPQSAVLFVGPTNAGAVDNVLITFGQSVWTWKGTPGTMRFTEREQFDDVHGSNFEQELSFDVPKDSALYTALRASVRNRFFTVKYTDRNGLSKLIKKCRVQSDFDTGGQNDGNKIRFRLIAQAAEPAPVMTGNFVNAE